MVCEFPVDRFFVGESMVLRVGSGNGKLCDHIVYAAGRDSPFQMAKGQSFTTDSASDYHNVLYGELYHDGSFVGENRRRSGDRRAWAGGRVLLQYLHRIQTEPVCKGQRKHNAGMTDSPGRKSLIWRVETGSCEFPTYLQGFQ